MPHNRTAAIGRNGERLAALLYAVRGYRILGRRVRTASAEVDLVCRRGSVLVLVEVKRRRRRGPWAARDDLGWRQAQRLARAAGELRRRHGWARRVRIDLVAIDGWRVRIHRDAIDGEAMLRERTRCAWT